MRLQVNSCERIDSDNDSFWQPLTRLVEDVPLAFCDWRNIGAEDVIAADMASSDYIGEVYYLKATAPQTCFWLSRQTPEEAFISTTFDTSRTSGVKGKTPSLRKYCDAEGARSTAHVPTATGSACEHGAKAQFQGKNDSH